MNICVYGAASSLIDKCFIDAAEQLGREMAKRGHSLVYGGGGDGVMGGVARGVHECGGTVIGIAPSFFNVDGMLFDNCTEIVRTETMRSRKELMEKRADAFIMAPGGIGTFDEFFEMLTLKQLSRHTKAIAIYNINGYFDDLLKFINHAMDEKFIKRECEELYSVYDSPADILTYLEEYKPVDINMFKFRGV